MEKRKMDNLGIEPSLLGFGCMRFPVTADGKIDEPEAEKMMDKAIAAGVNYIDTAYPYHGGQSEPFVGKVLKKYDRSSFYLATKMPAWMAKSVEDAERIFADQLKKLQTDHIDFYLLHAMDKKRWEEMVGNGVVSYCERLKAEGKITYFGFSFHDEYEVFEEILNYRDWDFCQIQLNYMDTNEQAGLKGYELAAAKGIPVIVMEPVKGGSLAAFGEDITVKFRAMDAEASTASWAFRFVGSLPGVKVILSGMSSMEQVEDNLKTFAGFQPLSAMEKAGIEEIVGILKGRVQNGCTGCRYCMPCPAGLDIPRNFKLWNTYHMYQNYNVVKWAWEQDMDAGERADKCIKCGKCEEVCPQKLPIREHLEQVQSDMDKKEMLL